MGSKIGTKRCLEQPKLVGLFRQSCGHQQNWYEKTLGSAKIRISYFGNLMVTITTNTKISLEHSKVLMDYIGNLQVTSKIGTKKSSWHNHSSYRLFWQSYGYHHKRYENQLGTCTVLMDHFLVIFRPPTKSVFVVEILWSPS